jgi:hypothetical protein
MTGHYIKEIPEAVRAAVESMDRELCVGTEYDPALGGLFAQSNAKAKSHQGEMDERRVISETGTVEIPGWHANGR